MLMALIGTTYCRHRLGRSKVPPTDGDESDINLQRSSEIIYWLIITEGNKGSLRHEASHTALFMSFSEAMRLHPLGFVADKSCFKAAEVVGK